MSTPAATQPAPLSQQIAALQAFVHVGGISHMPGAEVISPAETSIDVQQLRAAWEQLQEVVFGNDVQDSMHESFRHDTQGFFAKTTFRLAQTRIGSRFESLAQEEVNRVVLDHEGVDPFKLEQHAEDGLLLVEPVRAFNFSAAQYLQGRLNEAGIKLGDFILSAARLYYLGVDGPLMGLEDSARSFLKAVESRKDVVFVQRLYKPPQIHVQYLSMSSTAEAEVDQNEFFRKVLFPSCEKALRILVAGDTQLKHEDFFALPLLVRSDIGLIQALYRAGLMDARVVGAFLTKLNIMKKRPDGLAVM